MNLQASLYQPIITFSVTDFKPNKLIDKLVPAIQVDTTANTVKCKDGDVEVAIVRAQHSLPISSIVAFFQVEIIKCSASHPNECGINIGLITKDGNPRAYAGKYMNSIGYVNGQIYLNKKKISSVPHCGKTDRIGCGINCSNMSFFFTKNNEVIAKDITLPLNNKWNEFYPSVALQHQEEVIKCYFEKKDFVFDIDKFAGQIQKQIKTQIFNEEDQEKKISPSQLYSLISQYMLFNGYSKTLELMKQKKKQIEFQPINKLTKSIQGTKVLINLDEEKRIQDEAHGLMNIEAISDEENQQKMQKDRQDFNNNQSNHQTSRMRQRIMSDVHPQILQEQGLMIEEQNQPRRKNTQAMVEYELPANYKLRKQSNISNISIIDDQSIQNNQIEGKPNQHNQNHINNQHQLYQEKLTLNEKFLLNERLQILNFIKEKKIECAEKIIKEKIPKLYEVEPLLQAHMKAHIFLRKIIQEDQKSAIMYGHTEQKFSKNIDKQFPTYDSETGMIEMIPMKKILTSIISGKNKDHKFLKKQQFEFFAEYVNSLIMKAMGVMGNSRLGVILQHTSIVLRKLQQFKGMSCGVRLTN